MVNKKDKGSVEIPGIPKYINHVKVVPGNWVAKLLWRFIKINLVNEKIENPIFKAINQETNMFNFLPKHNWKPSADINEIK